MARITLSTPSPGSLLYRKAIGIQGKRLMHERPADPDLVYKTGT
jgi:hypothetical protein